MLYKIDKYDMKCFKKWICKLGKINSYAKIDNNKIYISWYECSCKYSLSYRP